VARVFGMSCHRSPHFAQPGREAKPHDTFVHAPIYPANERFLARSLRTCRRRLPLHFSHYNLVRLHKTLRVTPAMAANVTDRAGSLEEFGGADFQVKEFASQIYSAVRAGRLREPFGPDDVRRACPGWAKATYTVFLSKHCVGNPGGTTELFERVSPGRYRTLLTVRNSN
jgi:hypothetical protein